MDLAEQVSMTVKIYYKNIHFKCYLLHTVTKTNAHNQTGKTVIANTIAATLKKKLLLVNFSCLSEGQENGKESSSPMQSIFRKAELSNAI